MSTNNNKKNGNHFEEEFCELLALHGFWAHNMKKFNAELMAHPEWYEQKSVSGGVAVYYGIMMKTTG